MNTFDHTILGQLSFFAQDLSMGMSYMGEGQSYDIKRVALDALQPWPYIYEQLYNYLSGIKYIDLIILKIGNTAIS